MKKLLDPLISELNKERITAVIFYHVPTYRAAVVNGKFTSDSGQVMAFLKYKEKFQVSVIQRMGMNYKNKFGRPLTQPIVPFGYNDIYSDDDIITGTGKTSPLDLVERANQIAEQLLTHWTDPFSKDGYGSKPRSA